VSEAPGRPLPPVTDATEFFWTSGADGTLRLQECTSCDALIHPPQPVCRYCHSREMGVRAVSGRATLSSFTINHRFSLPGLPAPYVVAQVAIVEDPRVRLTTNIIDCDPEQLEIGQLMEVAFEHIEDVWLPLFRPAAEQVEAPQATDEIAPERFGEHVRPMVTRDKFEDKVALTGIGMSEIGRRLMRQPLSLTVDACQAAIADAGLTIDDIDGLSTYPGGGGFGPFSEGGVTALESALGIRPTWHNGGIETFGPGGSVIAAMLAVAGGLMYGGYSVVAMGATPGQFFSFLTAFLMAYEPAKRLARLNIELNSNLIGARKLLEIVDSPSSEPADDEKPTHRDTPGLLHVVRNPQHSETRPHARVDQRLDRRHGSDVEGCGRLVEQQHLWPHHQRTDECEPQSLPGRQPCDRPRLRLLGKAQVSEKGKCSCPLAKVLADRIRPPARFGRHIAD